SRLRSTITRFFDDEELRTLCFDLGISYDGLRGDGHAGKVREFVAYVFRRQREVELLELIAHQRPGNQFWDDALERVREEQRQDTGEIPALKAQQTEPLLRTAFIMARQIERFSTRLDVLTVWLAVLTLIVAVASVAFALMQ
ncbi:MAG: hypothetical protein ACYS30_25435, partial [Planctomycetota bacterium]